VSVAAQTAAHTEVLDALRAGDKFLCVTHEHPDGDALGSLIAMRETLAALGKDALMYVDPDEFPLPYEYRFLTLEGLVGVIPDDLRERTLVVLDCGNLDRNPFAASLDGDGERPRILNIDHHHDNTRFGEVNLVVDDASCTAEIVWELMGDLGVEPTQRIAEALYVGLVTDTGRFMYKNTGAKAHRMAAGLIDAGVDAFDVYRRIYEGVPEGKLLLLGRALARIERPDGGALTLTRLTAEDFAEAHAEESFSEGVIDHLRALEGVKVAALVRDRLGPGQEGKRKVSLRASDEAIDVSVIARSVGGGGHRQAAGFTTELEWDELIALLRDQVAAQVR
jgi:bifunctional oligoribonuclease and PAP phosphatase NrnA